MNAKTSVLVAAVLIVGWAVLAFGVQLRNGWVHVPLGVGVVFLARAIVVGDERTP
jgi:hypothetical protein